MVGERFGVITVGDKTRERERERERERDQRSKFRKYWVWHV